MKGIHDMKNPNKCRMKMFIFILIGLIIAGLSILIFGATHPSFLLGSFISFGSIVYGFITIRCPFCHKQLHLLGIIPDEYCPYCGNKLNN